MATIKRASTKPKKKQIERKHITIREEQKNDLFFNNPVYVLSGKSCTGADILDGLSTAQYLLIEQSTKSLGDFSRVQNSIGVLNMLIEGINETYGEKPISLTPADSRLQKPLRLIFIEAPNKG